MKKIQEIFKEQLQEIKPSIKDIEIIEDILDRVLSTINRELKKIRANCFIGGSFAKNTIIKKDHYDIDLFVRFPYSYKNKSTELSNILEKILKKIKIQKIGRIERLKGSRDYFCIKPKNSKSKIQTFLEIIPILQIKRSKDALNVTDISPLHVEYIQKKIKTKPALADEIKLAKAFCYAQGCYGAESYIRGFSGYCLEVLTCYYESFLQFLKQAAKWSKNKEERWKKKIIIDPTKYYRKKEDVFLKINKAKLLSPIILVDPVQSDRNIAAALSEEKVLLFAKACKDFLAHPSSNFFIKKKVKIIKKRGKKGQTIVLQAESSKKKEDVAGAKLLKFFKYLLLQFKKQGFFISQAEWQFSEKNKNALYFFTFKKQKQKKQLIKGPPTTLEYHVSRFRKKWPNCFVKNNVLYAFKKQQTIQQIINKAKKDMKEIGIKNIKDVTKSI